MQNNLNRQVKRIVNHFLKFASRKRIRILSIILSASIVFVRCSYDPKERIVIENNCFRYEIGQEGKNLHFSDIATGNDYLDPAAISYCAYIIQDGKQQNVTSISLKGMHLIFHFGNTGVSADVLVSKESDRMTLKVVSVTGIVESLTFLNIPLKLEGMPYEPFAGCALSMNLFTHVRQIPALQTHLWATCYKRFKLEGAEVTILGCPQQKILPLIRDVMSHAKDIPHSDKGGAWAQRSKEGYGSFLINFGTLTEGTVDEWIKMCRSLGFNQIDNHGGSEFFKEGFFRFGDFELNRNIWPDGWETFKRINIRLHAAGISSLFHTYAFFIEKNCKYVTPVPSEDLAYFNSFTLAEPLKEGDNVVVVKESTANVSTLTGYYVRNSRTLRVGNELIEFSGVTDRPPYKFTGCKRGANGTKISMFNANEKAYHLREMFSKFLPGPETPLFSEIARHTAEIVDMCGFDGIYLDAIDGSDILGGEKNFWYYGTKFIFEIAKNLKRPVGMEMSSMSHHWWHYRSRWQAWDSPVRGYKRFVDIHSAAIKSPRLFLTQKIKSNENEHGQWRGHTPLINQYAPLENGGLLLPLQLGWWGMQTWNSPQVEPSFPDDVEYLCCKMIGNNAGVSMLGGADEKNLEKKPLFRRLIAIMKQYEELRHKNYFSDSIRALLRQPGKEFTLFQEESGKWNFKPIAYQKHKVASLNHPSSEWITNNEFGNQPVKLRIEPLMSVKPYDHPDNIVLSDYSKPGEFTNEGNADGVSGGIKTSTEESKIVGKSGIFYANSSGVSPEEGSWIRMEKKFNPGLNIIKNQALGVWVKGDGNGQLLNFRIQSPAYLLTGARGDHFVKIDFKGWKYFELVEFESSDFSNYIWPASDKLTDLFVYDSYRNPVMFNNVDKLQLWYNNLPKGKEVACQIGFVKALPLVPITVVNPSVSIGGETITFPVSLKSGMYLEFHSQNDCKLFGTQGEFLQDVKIGRKIPILKNGDNQISFLCKGTEGVSSRVQVTVISEGNPLRNNN